MNRSDLERRSRPRTVPGRGLVALATLAVLCWAGAARAQTGGTTGTTTATLSTSDFFIGVQKVEGINLSDADKAKFLNHASCQCKRDVWLKAILINAASAAKAQTIAGTDVVTMMIGQGCDQAFYYHACLTLATTPLSDFRVNGLLVHTTVDVLAGSYGTGTTTLTGTGGTGDATVVSGTGGDSGSSGATTATDHCAVGDAYSQPVYIFVESTPTLYDGGSGQLNVVIDGSPPPTPAPVTVGYANEALLVNWTAVDAVSVPDIQGYQVFCSRADQYQVFKDGTFSTSVDSCPGTDAVYVPNTIDGGADQVPSFPTDLDPLALMNANTHYICSDFLSTSTSSHRVQILENDIPYGISVAAVDSHGNASLAFAGYTRPQQTLDFYHQYRNGDPQGQATGGCSIAGEHGADDSAAAWTSLGCLGLVLGALTKRRGRCP